MPAVSQPFSVHVDQESPPHYVHGRQVAYPPAGPVAEGAGHGIGVGTEVQSSYTSLRCYTVSIDPLSIRFTSGAS
jgi:hypothetical protein